MTTASASSFGLMDPGARWRTVDILTAAVIGVTFGVVFWASNLLFVAAFPAFGPVTYAMSGVWLLPAVVAPLVIRKPGAAIFAEVAAASVSALLGSVWGLDTILSGFVQGAGAELIFALTLYRGWNPAVAMLAAAGAVVGEAVHDFTLYKELLTATVEYQVIVVVAMLLSGVLVAGLGGWLLVRTLRQTGVLESFPSTR